VTCCFVTGVSGVGKTTALGLVSETAPPHLCFRDIDERGVPAGVDSAWRREQVAAWLDTAARLDREGRVLVLSGVVEPGDVYDGHQSVDARFCLLDASDEVLAARLLGRLEAPGAADDLMRATGHSPQRFVDAVTRHAASLRASFTGRADTTAIDTSHLTAEQVAAAVGDWLRTAAGPAG
jgi:RNase adaptor protein for sRNA GlmZ degradation